MLRHVLRLSSHRPISSSSCSSLLSLPRSMSSTSFESSINPRHLWKNSEPKNKQILLKELKKSNDTDFDGYFPLKELEVTTMLSGSAGGQHANKSETKVDVRFHLDSATFLSDQAKNKIREKLGSQMTRNGYLVSKSSRTRSQLLNRADALQKLRENIWECLRPEPELEEDSEEFKEKRRKNYLKMARQRVREKRMRSQVIKDRKLVDWEQ